MNNETAEQPVSPLNPGTAPIGCPKCGREFKNGMALRMHNIRKHKPGGGWNTSQNFGKKNWRAARIRRLANLNRKGGKPWTKEQRAKFAATWKAKSIQHGRGVLKRFKPIVYPAPKDQEPWKAENRQYAEEKAAVRRPDHCPHCGENITAWRYEP